MNELDLALQLTNLSLSWFQPLFAAETGLLASWGGFFYNVMLVALGLGFVIFVHELGHFLAAKAFGVQCDKFYVGFDVPLSIGPIKLPSKLFHFQWGETEYGIGTIPLGGYVKMLGQDDDPRNAIAEAERAREAGEEPAAPKLNPRSFLAKSVFARMVIISAGVVMNLITGVLMAAAAFHFGVPYDAPVIGNVIPGDPAWKAGLQPGDRLVKVNKTESEELSFRDMQQSLVFSGLWNPEKPVELGIEREGERFDVSIVGSTAHSDPSLKANILTLGFRSTGIAKLSSGAPISKQYTLDPAYPASSLPDLKSHDIIVGIDGTPLPISSQSDIPLTYELGKRIEPRLADTVTLNVMRLKDPANPQTSEREAVDVVSNPVSMKTLGVGFLPESVVAVQDDSLGAQEGIAPGMKVVRWDGNPIDDSFRFVLLLAGKRGTSTEVEFEDAEGNVKKLTWQVPEEFYVTVLDSFLAPVGLEIPGTGIVFSVSNVVGRVEPNLPGAKAGLQPGDKFIQMKLSPTSESDKKYFEETIRGGATLTQELAVDRLRNMQYWTTIVQLMKTDLPIKVNYERDSKVNHCELTVVKDPNLHWPDRGFIFSPLMRTHHVGSVSDALGFGVHEIGKRAQNVLEFLGLLVTGNMPFRFVGGPGAIAMEATDAASKGISPLLMFLTLLSANLAIINFLPIPALDGGHMLFLIIEAIIGRPVDEELEGKLRMVGVIGLLALMAAVIFNDVINISRLLGG